MSPSIKRAVALALVLGASVLVGAAVLVISRGSGGPAMLKGGPKVRLASPSQREAEDAEAEPTVGGEPDGRESNEIAGREQWFYGQRAYPAKRTPKGALPQASRQANALALASSSARSSAPSAPTQTLTWTGIGPKPIGSNGPANVSVTYSGPPPYSGRVSAIAPDPNNANVVYLGGAAGGIWKSTDGGTTWTPKFPNNNPSFAIGAIAVDRSNSSNVWVGTGEPNSGWDTYYGQGIYKSTNGGTSWTKVGGTLFNGCFVYDLVVVDPSTIVAAIAEFPGVRNPACSRRGIWRTTNGGASWSHIALPNSVLDAPTDLSQAPGAPSTIFVAAYGQDGIYKSTNGGASFTQLATLTGGNPGRGVISAYDADVAYFAYDDTSPCPPGTSTRTGSCSLLWSAFKTTDGGGKWSQVVAGGGTNTPCTYPGKSVDGQCFYDLTLAVDPTDSTRFYLGGIRMFRYTNSGATPAQIGYGACGGCMHVDQHAVAFDRSNRLWVGNDGGVYRTDNTGASFINRNATLAITEFNPWTSGSLSQNMLTAGTQDNGTLKYTASTGLNWQEDRGGDGGATAFVSPTTYYGSYFGKDLLKTTNGGQSYTNVSGPWGSDGANFYSPLEMSPANTAVLYRGTSRIWRTTNGAASWSPISPIFNSTSNVSAIGPAKSKATVIYGGWTAPSGGTTQLRYTTDGGASWNNVPAGQLPNRYITDINVSPTNPSTAIATFSGFNATTPSKVGHIFRTTNGGATWTNISGNLPDTPVNAVAVDYSKNPARIFVGTDVGVFWSVDGGATWGNTSTGLPNTIVMDLRIDGTNLLAFTHGRGAFKAPLGAPPPPRPAPPSR